MSVPFVGEGHRKLVDDLAAEFERVCAERTPSWWSLEANTGWGKTRVLQEFYGRLAESQPEPRYWPPSILTAAEEGVHVQRKRVHPPLINPPAGASPAWFWWGISCSSRHGLFLNALVHDLERFEERREAIERRFRKLSSSSARLQDALHRRKGEVAEAAVGDALGAATSAASLAVPGLGLLLLLGKWGVGHARAEHRRRVTKDLGGEGQPRTDLIEDMAPALERFASAGIPLLVVVEDIHEADDVLIELVARVLAAKSAPIFVVTTSWRGMIDQPHRSVHSLLDRVADDRRQRVLCERDIQDLSLGDLGEIVGAVLPTLDPTSRDRLAQRFPNPYALQLACQTRVVRRSAATGSIPMGVVANLPREVDALFRQLWEELPEPLRRALVVANQMAPGSVSAQIGFGDLRWDPELVSMAVDRVGWLAEDLPELANSMRDARDAYAWIRTVDEWLQRFHDPAQHEIAANALRDEYGLDEQFELRAAGGHAAIALIGREPEVSDERAINRDHLLVALASEELLPWNYDAARAATRVCELALELGGAAELRVAIEICDRALRNPGCGFEQVSLLRAWHVACLGESGRVREAVQRCEKLLEDQTRALGFDAPEVLRTRKNLSGWLGRSGRVKEAIERYEQLLDDETRVLGPDSPETLSTRNGLARWIAAAGRVKEAIDLFERLLEDQTRGLGPNARDTLITRNNLASLLAEDGRVNEAIRRYEQLLNERTRLLGPDAPDTLLTRNNLANCLAEDGRMNEAIERFEQLLEDQIRVLGPDAPDTLLTRNNLANCIGKDGRVNEAIGRYEQLLEDETRVLGPDAPLVLTTRNSLAGWLASGGRARDAGERYQQLLKDRTRVLGSDAPDTLVTRANLAGCLGNQGLVTRSLSSPVRRFVVVFSERPPSWRAC